MRYQAFGTPIIGDVDAFWFSLRVIHVIDAEGNDYIKAETQDPPAYGTRGVNIRA